MGHLGAAAVFEILSDNGYSCVSPVHCEKYLGCYVERTARSVTLTEIIDSHA